MVRAINWLQDRIILISLLSATCSIACAANTTHSEFSISVDRQQVEYGRSIVLTVRSKQSDSDPGPVPLSVLEDDFAIEKLNGQTDTSNDISMQQWRLYPRRPGQLRIPALHYADHQSEPINLNVTPAIDPRNGQPIHITIETPEAKVWLRQAVYLRMTLETASPIIVLRRDEANYDGLTVRELMTTEKPVEDKRQRYRHTTGWVAHALRDGKHQFALPPLRYVRDGITTHRFFPPLLKLDVRPLPHYLPPAMPVGRLSIQLDVPNQFVFTEELRHLTLKIQGQGIRHQNMPRLERQLASSAGITLYPAQQKRQESTAKGRLNSQIEYEVPFVLTQNGALTLPDFRLDYFDPASGRIITSKKKGETIYAINRSVFYTLTGGLLFLLGWSLIKLLPYLIRYGRRMRAYIRVLASLPVCESGEQVVKLLQELAWSEGWPPNLTLAHWLQYWQNHYAPDTRLNQAIEALTLYRYAGAPLDIRHIRKQIYTALSRQHLVLGWVSRLKPMNA